MNAAKIFLLLFLFFSCKAPRDGTTVVEGQVVDRQTGAPVADATVSLMKSRTSSSSAAYTLVKDIQAGADGRFSFSFEGDGDNSYILMATTPIGHYTWWQEAPDITSGRKNKNVKVKAQAPAWVRVKLVDEPPASNIVFYIQGCKERLQNDLFLSADTSFIVTVDGGTSTVLYYWITRNGIKTGFSEAVSPAALDTTLLEINF